MRSRSRAFVQTLAVSVLLAPYGLADNERPRLRHNPFEGPRADAAYTGSASGRDSFRPVLKATSNAGENSIANLGGVILRIGEEAHGYRLVSVSDGEAEFDRAGTLIKLKVAPGPGGRGRP